MLRSYLVVAFRSLAKRKVSSAINIFGLSVGITCFILIGLYVRFELSFDTFHADNHRIYRVVQDVSIPTGLSSPASFTGAAAPALQNDFPEIEGIVRLRGASMLVANGDKRFQEENIFFADHAIFDVFTFPLLSGDASSALVLPNHIVLTASASHRYFGDQDPVGKVLVVDNEITFIVDGVIADLPPNSHLQFDLLVSLTTMNQQWRDGWNWAAFTYVRLSPSADAKELQSRFPDFVSRHTGASQWDKEQRRTLSLQPLVDIHLFSSRTGEPGTVGSLTNLVFFGALAIVILLVACINFVTLSTAQAAHRAREAGLRKTLGSTSGQLTLQFLLESVLVSLAACVLALVACDLLLPVFRNVAGVAIILDDLYTPTGLIVVFLLAVTIGCLAGFYPAVLQSRFKPVVALKGHYGTMANASFFDKSLIVLQFGVSIALILGTIVIYSQLRFMQQQDLGYSREEVVALYFGDDSDVQENSATVREELARSPYVSRVATSSHLPGQEPGARKIAISSTDGSLLETDANVLAVDYDFMSFYNVALIAGREFSSSFPYDATESIVINETAAHTLGYNNVNDIIGASIALDDNQVKVIGVAHDFHYASMHKRIGALVIRMRPKSLSYFSLSINTTQVEKALADLAARWKTLAPHRPFSYSFLDKQFESRYQADMKFGQIFSASSVLAIVLACLGLFGLTSFSVQQRTREIAIRKVLGAPVTGIVVLLAADFVRLIALAIVFFLPLAFYLMKEWLSTFAYRTDIRWWMLLAAGGAALVVAILTISMKSLRAATVNPVQSLRSE